jgi:hypothetical protein
MAIKKGEDVPAPPTPGNLSVAHGEVLKLKGFDPKVNTMVQRSWTHNSLAPCLQSSVDTDAIDAFVKAQGGSLSAPSGSKESTSRGWGSSISY